MSDKKCDTDCTISYLTTGVFVAILWLTAAVAFWYLKVRKVADNKENSSSAQDIIQMSEENQDSNMIYREVVFNNHNKKPKETKSEETTYAEIKNTSQQDDGLIYTEIKHNATSKAKNTPHNCDLETTYAEVKLMSEKSKPEDGSKDLYASVKRQKTPTNTKT